MLAPALSSGKRCSWCGMFSSENDFSCSKCGAVFSGSFVLTHAKPAVTLSAPVEEDSPSTGPVIAEIRDSLPLDTVSGEAMLSLGLGPQFISGQTVAFAIAGC